MKITKSTVLFFLCLLLTTAVACSPSQKEQDAAQPDNEFDLIVFAGQSNMVGRDTALYETALPEGISYWYSYSDEVLYPMKNPVGENGLGFSKSSGSSVIPAFCEEYYRRTGRKTIAILTAMGGVRIDYFMPGSRAFSGMGRYVKNCESWLAKNGYTVGHRFYVMFQGESDSGGEYNRNYAADYMQFHTAFKDSFDYEFGALILNGHTVGADLTGMNSVNGDKIRMAQENDDLILASSAVPLHFFTEPDWVFPDDGLNGHLTCKGLIAVGTEAADSIANYLGYGEPEQKGVDPVTYLPLPE